MNTDSTIRGFHRSWVSLAIAALLGTAAGHAAPVTSLPAVAPLLPYAVFGNQYEMSDATTIGNVGISNGGLIAYNANVSISGRLDLGFGATALNQDTGDEACGGDSGMGGGGGGAGGGEDGAGGGVTLTSAPGIGGGIRSGLDLSVPQGLVASASAALAALAPTSTQTVVSGTGKGTNTLGSANAIDDVQVFDLSSMNLTGNRTLKLVGDPGDFFVLNVLEMNVKGRLVLGTEAQADHTFINLYDTSGEDLGRIIWGESQVYGTLLIPYGAAQLKGTVSGALWSGSGTVTLTESATVINVPLDPPAVPDPAGTSLLTAFGGGLLLILRRFSRFG